MHNIFFVTGQIKMLTFELNWDSIHGQLFENQTKRGGGDEK